MGVRRQIESNLRGTIYDPFVRWLVVEGLGRWWRDDVSDWLACPASDPDVMRVRFRRPDPESSLQQVPLGFGDGGEDEVLICPKQWAAESHKVTCSYVRHPAFPSERSFADEFGRQPFPVGYDPHSTPPPELGGPGYYGRIRRDKVVESLLVKAGIRLAATLNAVFASDEELVGSGPLNLGWRDGKEGQVEAGRETGWTRAVASVRRGGSWIV